MADIIVNTEIKSDLDQLFRQFEDTLNDDATMIQIYNLFGKMIEPWVPMDTGILAHSYEVTPNYLKYPGPYAHYQYMGILYGPTYPIFEGGDVKGFYTNPYGKKAPFIVGGNLVGYYSPPHKYPTGEDLTYSAEKHERASKEWDKAAMKVVKDQFLAGVKDILIRRHKELYG